MRALPLIVVASLVIGCRDRSTSGAPAPSPSACLDVATERAAPREIRGEGGALVGCWDASCVSIANVSARVVEAPPPAFAVHATDRTIEVCNARCASITPGYFHGFYSSEARPIGGSKTLVSAANEDGTKLFVLAARMKVDGSSDVRDLEVFGDTFDVARGVRIAHVDLAGPSHVLRDPSDRWSVAWIGDRVHVRARSCCGPFGADEILDPSTGVTAMLGYAHVVEALGSRAVAATSTAISIVDLATPSIASTTPLPNRPAIEGTSFARKLDDGSIAIAFTNPPGLALVDATAATHLYDVTRCR